MYPFYGIQNVIVHKKTEYYNSKITELEETTKSLDKERFWQCLKSMDDTRKEKDDLPLGRKEGKLALFFPLT